MATENDGLGGIVLNALNWEPGDLLSSCLKALGFTSRAFNTCGHGKSSKIIRQMNFTQCHWILVEGAAGRCFLSIEQGWSWLCPLENDLALGDAASQSVCEDIQSLCPEPALSQELCISKQRGKERSNEWQSDFASCLTWNLFTSHHLEE
ncbi:hypothetical protein Y1Q_0002227 [Alligator mississippiensis]|uniref:Uncharacterized protein n=1 Tax=Alligator mississippiensis TaxID=8496 RepID=A0A151MGS1_ALLMI|nr:hypothetical protein Y1Q_0002227 [Alligator mississippiensis]